MKTQKSQVLLAIVAGIAFCIAFNSCTKTPNSEVLKVKVTPPPAKTGDSTTTFYLIEEDTASRVTGVYAVEYEVGPDSCWYKSPLILGGKLDSTVTTASGTCNYQNVCNPIQSSLGGTYTYTNKTLNAGAPGASVANNSPVSWKDIRKFTIQWDTRHRKTYATKP